MITVRSPDSFTTSWKARIRSGLWEVSGLGLFWGDQDLLPFNLVQKAIRLATFPIPILMSSMWIFTCLFWAVSKRFETARCYSFWNVSKRSGTFRNRSLRSKRQLDPLDTDPQASHPFNTCPRSRNYRHNIRSIPGPLFPNTSRQITIWPLYRESFYRNHMVSSEERFLVEENLNFNGAQGDYQIQRFQ